MDRLKCFQRNCRHFHRYTDCSFHRARAQSPVDQERLPSQPRHVWHYPHPHRGSVQLNQWVIRGHYVPRQPFPTITHKLFLKWQFSSQKISSKMFFRSENKLTQFIFSLFLCYVVVILGKAWEILNFFLIFFRAFLYGFCMFFLVYMRIECF